MKVKTITIDTNCINTKQGKEAINKLEKWHTQGLVKIFKTDVMDTELSNSDHDFREKALKKSQSYPEDIGVGVVDHSRVGHCRIGGDSIDYPLEEIRKLLFPQYEKFDDAAKRRAIRDSMHLATHKMHKRDAFVTEDKHFLNKRDSLKEHFGITVLSPEEVLEKIEAN
jgi:hypothetical protein